MNTGVYLEAHKLINFHSQRKVWSRNRSTSRLLYSQNRSTSRLVYSQNRSTSRIVYGQNRRTLRIVYSQNRRTLRMFNTQPNKILQLTAIALASACSSILCRRSLVVQKVMTTPARIFLRSTKISFYFIWYFLESIEDAKEIRGNILGVRVFLRLICKQK